MSSNTHFPITMICLTHRSDEKFRAALAAVAWADQVVVGWASTEAPPAWLKDQPRHEVIKLDSVIRDFAATRNGLLKHAKHDWVFFIDSDEVVGSDTIVQLRQLIEQPEVAGAFIHRQDVFWGKKLQWGEVTDLRLIRVFRKDLGQFVRPIHEKVVVNGRVVDSQILVTHYAHDSIASFLQKITQYAEQESTFRDSDQVASTWWAMITWPIGKFFYNYFLKLGFLDSWQGLIYAVMMSIHSFTLRARLYEKRTLRTS